MNFSNKQCTGCGACKQICPLLLIEMKEDNFGFKYPYVSDPSKCKKCGLCSLVCSYRKDINNVKSNLQECYAVVNNKLDVVSTSSSGGFFPALAEYVLERNGVVYGCAWNLSLKAEHLRITNKTELIRLSGSKYVQSNIKNTYIETRKDLNSGKIVLFSGTPCQIDGLKCFLGQEYQTLITVDLICHGVPSQRIFDKYISGLEKAYDVRLNDFIFRNKKNNKGWCFSCLAKGVKNDTKKEFQKELAYFDSYYYFYFLKGYIYRECCYQCKYTTLNRVSDFTIGDFWGIEGLNLSFNTELGCNSVIVNTEKAKRILSDLDVKAFSADLEYVLNFNKQLCEPTKIYENRISLLNNLIFKDECYNDSYFKKKFKKTIIISKLKYMIPAKLRFLINKLRYSFKP